MTARSTRAAAAALAVLLGTGGRAPAAEDILAPAAAVAALADGKPWLARPQDGPSARLTLNPGGTGSFEGPISVTAHWAVRGREICITIGPMGEKCLQFRRVEGGFQGLSAGRPDLVLLRQDPS